MDVLFIVPWIEIEYGWGDRPEGYKVFTSEEECISTSKEDSRTGVSETMYFGPVRPLRYYTTTNTFNEVPKWLDKVEFKSDPVYIK